MSDSGFSASSPRHPSTRPRDVAQGLAARTLWDHPRFADWHGRAISAEARRLLANMNDQELMGLAAACLVQLESGPRSTPD